MPFKFRISNVMNKFTIRSSKLIEILPKHIVKKNNGESICIVYNINIIVMMIHFMCIKQHNIII